MTHHETLTFPTGGLTLQARWDLPEDPQRAVVLCHPHPMQRGTMNAPLVVAIAESLAHDGFAVLRFNFRGVGDSTGEHDFGEGEMDDIAAAVEVAAARFPQLPLGVAGWSFGAVTSLRWQARDGATHNWVGVATPVGSTRSKDMPEPSTLSPAQRTMIIGDRDQFASAEDTRTYADSIGAHLEVLKGSDHFFYFREEKVASLVAAGLSEPV
ncbi:MAG: alpha/beta fold hydrolase [Acidimicrobiia bacterium]|nr:alpha/beta fold hydrolase [Acidimicrobiia bacterium]